MNEGARLGLINVRETSASDVIEKLRRELQRIEQANDPEAAADHVINAFWSAWYVHKWMWNAIDGKPDLRQAVLEYRGISHYKIDDDVAFGAALASRFVPLKICRQVATSPRFVDVSPLLPETCPHISMKPMPKIVILGKLVSAISLLNEIDDYWVTMIVDCGIEG